MQLEERPRYTAPNTVKVCNERTLYQPYNVMPKKPKYLVYDIENYMNGLFFGVFILLDEGLNEVLSPFLFTEKHVNNIINWVYETEITLVGFNNHHYDDKMLANIYFGRDPNTTSHELIKVPFSKAGEFDLMCHSIDVFKDVQGSLKYYEAVMGMNIMESGVPFDISRHLTQEEFENEVLYCLTDVRATVHAFRFRMNPGQTSIQSKLKLIKDNNLPHWYTRKTNNEITAEILGGESIDWSTAYDELFDLPTLNTLIKEHLFNIPEEIIQMYKDYHKEYHDKVRTVENRKEFKAKFTKKFKQNLYDLETMQFIDSKDPIFKDKKRRIFLNKSFGGEHTMNFFEIIEGILLFADFGSYYPSIIDVFLRHIKNTNNPNIYRDLLDGRISNKHAIDAIKETLTEEEQAEIKAYYNKDLLHSELSQNAREVVDIEGAIVGIKLILNCAFGVMGSPTNGLFHPIKLSTVTVVGQLLITELIFRVFKYCPTAMLVQSNTDGVLFKVDTAEDEETFKQVCTYYAKEIGISIDVEKYKKMIQSTVNNYILIDDKKPKMKGATTKNYKGSAHVEQAGRITNNLSIKSKALVDYFVHGTSVEETVYNETDIGRFQYIASTNRKIVGFYNQTTGEWELKNNRIMVLKDSTDTIVKVTKENVNKFIEDDGGTRIPEDDSFNVGEFKDVFVNNQDKITTLGIAQHVGVKVTNVTHETNEDLLSRIDREFYVKMCKEHIETFVKGAIEEDGDDESEN